MNAEQKIKHLIIEYVKRCADDVPLSLPEITAANVDEIYEELRTDPETQDSVQEAEYSEVRSTGIDTGLRSQSSRHYECKEVAAQAPDGSWVGWTYWYGGGKHGEPESIGWMDEAYDLTVTEEEKIVTVRTFAKVA